MTSYHTWYLAPVTAADRQWRVASKPGALGHGQADLPTQFLAEWIATAAGSRSLHVGSGTGLVSAVALGAGGAEHVWCADRSIVGVEATRRTLEAHGATVGGAVLDPTAPVPQAVVVHAQGTHGLPPQVTVSSVTLRIPTDKSTLQALLWDGWQRLAVGGQLALAGANDEGAKSAASMLESLAGHARVLRQAGGCRLVVATKGVACDAPPDAFASPYLDPAVMHPLSVPVGDHTLTLATRPGVFSWAHLDEATRILLDTMTVHAGESVLDLGCGAGPLGLAAVLVHGARRALLLDADAEAVRCTAHAIAAHGASAAEVRASDVAEAAGEECFDVVLTNPPFHVGKATALDVPRQFIAESWDRLRPGGRLYLVANRTLPYERVLAERFGTVRTVHDGRRFKVLSATR